MKRESVSRPPGYLFETLQREHDIESFNSGHPALDRYLKQQARQDVRRGFASVVVGVEVTSGAVHGYYTLSMSSVALDLIPDDLRRKMPRYPTVPAVRVGRLAVTKAAQGQGRGTAMLVDALRRSYRTDIAWTAVIVDAKDEQAAGFYHQFGFQRFLDDPLHLFLPRGVVEKLFAEK